jgi:protein gp37
VAHSTIEWTESTWNPVTGCDDASPGCFNCYARRMSHRLKAMGAYNYRRGFRVTLQPQMLDRPLHWKKPQRIFVNSMSDLFHVDVPTDYVRKVFDTMNAAHWHQYQVLTKRSGRLLKLSPQLPWTSRIWMGVSVENADYVRRIDHLRRCGAHVKFLSLEPLIGPLPRLELAGIDWVIVGGESGPGARPMDAGWVREIRDQCLDAGVACVFKKKTGRELDDRTWDQYPVAAPA